MLMYLGKRARLFTQGQRLAAQYHFAAALEAFEHALRLRPQTAGLHLHRALALAEMERLAEAVEAMQHALALQPTNPVLPMFLGQIFFDAAEYAEAQVWCQRALALQPYNLHALALQALIEMAQGRIGEGYQSLQRPPALPITALERGLRRLGMGRLPSLLRLSNAAVQSRLLLLAESYLLRWQTLGRTLTQQLLQADASTLASSHPSGLLAAIDRCCTRGVMGGKRLAIRLRYARQPTQRAFWLLQATAEEAYYLGQAETARSLYTQLVQQAPDLHSIRQRLYEVCYEQGEFHSALRHFRYLVTSPAAPASPNAWQSLLLGELLYQVGHYDEAAAPLQHAAGLGLRDYKLFYYLGLCQLRTGARRAARRRFEQAVQLLNPGLAGLRLEELYRVYQSALSSPNALSH
jgi:tetratricopeptide (TPR) repeat protein